METNKEIARKLNYLLAKQDGNQSQHEDLLSWLSGVKKNLEYLIQVQEKLSDEGLTIEDLEKQIEYGNEYRAISDFVNEYNAISSDGPITTQPGTFIFENDMLPEFSQRLHSIPDDIENTIYENQRTGMLIIPLSIVNIKNTKTNVYFNSKNKTNSLVVIQQADGPKFTFKVDQQEYEFEGHDSKISNMNQLNKVIQRRILILTYTTSETEAEIHNMECIIDTKETSFTFIESTNYATIPFADFVTFCTHLPTGVKNVFNIFADSTEDGYDAFRKIYITTILIELIPQVNEYYEATYGNNLTYGLYGQGAAVSISQLYNLAKSTLRREEVLYSFEDGVTSLKPIVYVEKQLIKDQFIMDFPFTNDQVWGLTRDYVNSTVNNTWRWTNFPIKFEGVTVANDQVVLTDVLKNTRPTANKIKIGRKTPDETYTSEAWFEQNLSNFTEMSAFNLRVTVQAVASQKIIPEKNYKINGIAGGKISNNFTGTAEFYGINLLVNDTTETEFDLILQRTYRARATQITSMIIKPDNLSSESTNSLEANVTYSEGFNDITKKISFTPKRIEYGQLSVNVYVGTISTGQTIVNFTTSSRIRFQVGTGANSYGSAYEGNQLTDYRNYTNSNTFKVANPSNMAIAKAENISSLSYAKPGCVYDNANHRSFGMWMLSPPFSWQSWDGKFSVNYTSMYLSVGPTNESKLPSSLQMRNRSVNFTATPNQFGEKVTGIGVWGYEYQSQTFTTHNEVNTIKTSTSGTFSPISGLMHTTVFDDNQITLKTLTGSVVEIILPSGVYNQFTLSESITNLQTSVAFLSLYADYLKYLIDNLNDRVTIVEKTMDDVIQAINAIVEAITPKQQTIGGSILSFLGSSIGMFFPLTGLAINIIGNVYDGIVHLQDGNVTTGVMDITTGALMSVLGIRKFKQRMDRKYGNTETVERPAPPNEPPSYESLFGKPGFNTVSTSITPNYVLPTQTSSGVIKNADIHYDAQKTAVITLCMQQGLLNSYFTNPLRLRRDKDIDINIAIGGKITETWVNLSKDVSYDYKLIKFTFDRDYNMEEVAITQQEFIDTFKSNVKLEEFVKWLYVYSNLGIQLSEGIGLDNETFSLIAVTNLADGISGNPVKSRTTSKYTYYTRSLKNRSLKTTNLSLPNSMLTMNDLECAISPYYNRTNVQIRLFDNMYNYVEKVQLN